MIEDPRLAPDVLQHGSSLIDRRLHIGNAISESGKACAERSALRHLFHKRLHEFQVFSFRLMRTRRPDHRQHAEDGLRCAVWKQCGCKRFLLDFLNNPLSPCISVGFAAKAHAAGGKCFPRILLQHPRVFRITERTRSLPCETVYAAALPPPQPARAAQAARQAPAEADSSVPGRSA